MIFGIGTDIIEVKRIEQAIKRFNERILNRLFSQHEQEYCLSHRDSARHFAGRFAAKEAVVKALGTGFRDGITWLDIEINNDEKGKPFACLSTKLQEALQHSQVIISISHCREYATATAIHLQTERIV